MTDVAAIRSALLSWYDREARVLPWRTGPAAGQGRESGERGGERRR
jgi:A/G-specific adenine glycosylase